MDITYDMTGTLRAETHGHVPVVLVDYENHGQDSRYKDLGNVCETVSQKYGTGGNNTPLVLEIYENLHTD